MKTQRSVHVYMTLGDSQPIEIAAGGLRCNEQGGLKDNYVNKEMALAIIRDALDEFRSRTDVTHDAVSSLIPVAIETAYHIGKGTLTLESALEDFMLDFPQTGLYIRTVIPE